MNSQEKPTKMKIVYVQAIKIERANVKIHINYCYNGHLYALFTCFVFSTPHHTTAVDTYPETLILHVSTPTQTQSLPFTLCTERFVYVAADHFGFTILFRCNFRRVFISFFAVHVFTLTPGAPSYSLSTCHFLRFHFSRFFFRVTDGKDLVQYWVLLHYHQL